MAINQLSVFAENKPGAITDITQTLAEAGIDIRALSLADTRDYGILRLIVSDNERARAALEAKQYLVTVTGVIVVALSDKPGSLSDILAVLDRNKINIEYMYAFMARTVENAYVVLRVADAQAAEIVLGNAKAQLLAQSDIADWMK